MRSSQVLIDLTNDTVSNWMGGAFTNCGKTWFGNAGANLKKNVTDVKPKVLVVDDERYNLKLLANLLKNDYKIIAAKSGEQAIEKTMALAPDLILLDVVIPGMDGYEVVKRLKSNDATKDIAVIFVTTLDSSEDEEKGLKLGALDYIRKPFKPSVVKARVRNIMTLTRQRKLLEELVHLDPLTEIHNRRYFDKMLTTEWDRCCRLRSALSLIMIDIDFFKQFNDTYGHSAGDEALRAVAAILKQTLKRAGDMAFRYGGEEFSILAPNSDTGGASLLAEMIRSGIQQLAIPHENSGANSVLTISAGGATEVPSEFSSPLELLRKSDAMLYRAKSSGRNRVVWLP